ncbi:Uncharacterised protein [Aeromonas salmonicida]|nr:Uncharacterised protein [Aeromonas salmonicida]SPT78547.1 Uncharacterised protein [Aeromonas salmonicida]
MIEMYLKGKRNITLRISTHTAMFYLLTSFNFLRIR